MILAHLENRPMTPTAVLQARLARGWPRGWARSEQKREPSGDGEAVGVLLIFLGTKKIIRISGYQGTRRKTFKFEPELV